MGNQKEVMRCEIDKIEAHAVANIRHDVWAPLSQKVDENMEFWLWSQTSSSIIGPVSKAIRDMAQITFSHIRISVFNL